MSNSRQTVSTLFLLPFFLLGVAILVIGVPTGFIIGGAATMHGLGAFDPPYADYFNERSANHQAEKAQRKAEAESSESSRSTSSDKKGKRREKKDTRNMCTCIKACDNLYTGWDDSDKHLDCLDKCKRDNPDGAYSTAVRCVNSGTNCNYCGG